MKNIMYCLLMSFFFFACQYENKEDLYPEAEEEDCLFTEATFAVDIIPVLLAHCNTCHRNDRQDGNVNLEGYTNVKPYVDDGSLYGCTNHEQGFSVMPTSGVKIPFCDIEKIRLWIEAGAQDN